MKAFILITVLSLQVYAGGQDGNGGGGLYENGTYKTFYSAGLFVEPIYLTDAELPNLRVLRTAIREMELNPNIEGHFIQSLTPSFGRKFLNVDVRQFDVKTYERLKDTYRELYNIPEADIVIYAVTDVRSGVTYILPEFYKLTSLEQKVILLHETLWLLRPNASYLEVNTMDTYSQNFFTKQNEATLFVFVEALDHFLEVNLYGGRFGGGDRKNQYYGSAFGMSLKKDQKSGALSQIVSADGLVNVRDLLGPQALKCILGFKGESSLASDQLAALCGPMMKNHWSMLQDKYPSSLFLRALLNISFPHVAEMSGDNLFRSFQISELDFLKLEVQPLYEMGWIRGIVNEQNEQCESTFFGGQKCKTVTKRYLAPLLSLVTNIFFSFTEKGVKFEEIP